MTLQEMSEKHNMSLRFVVVNYLKLHWFFNPGGEIKNDVLEAASTVGLDPLEIIRSNEYNKNPQHYFTEGE